MPDPRIPGPMCIDHRASPIDDGTSAQACMPPPGPVMCESPDTSLADLERALGVLEAEGAQFAMRFIKDSKVRLNYLAEIRNYSAKILTEVNTGRISAHNGHLLAHEARNTIMDAMRLKSSDIGRAYAESLKAQGWTLEQLYAKYAQELFNEPFDALTDSQRNRVKLKIIKSAGRDRFAATRAAGRLGQLGKGLWVLTIGIAVYNVSTAEDKVEAVAREGTTIGGGIAGGAIAGAATGLVCGPGAVVCSSVLVVVGGALGALSMSYVFDWVWE